MFWRRFEHVKTEMNPGNGIYTCFSLLDDVTMKSSFTPRPLYAPTYMYLYCAQLAQEKQPVVITTMRIMSAQPRYKYQLNLEIELPIK